MKQLIESSQHSRATNYAKHKITEGVSDTRIIGELVALEKIRKSTATEIIKQAKCLLKSSTPHTEVFSLYEWIQDWLTKGLSHQEMIIHLQNKGIDEAQACEILQEAIDFQVSKTEKTNKAKSISLHSPEIHKQIRAWRKQLIPPYTIKQKLRHHYNLDEDEAQDLLYTALLHKKAQQEIEIQVLDKCPNNPIQYSTISGFLLLCILGTYLFVSGTTNNLLITLYILCITGFAVYKFIRRTHNKTSYLK